MLIAAHIDGEAAFGRDYVVLCAGLDDCDGHFYGSQHGRDFLESEIAEPFDVVQCFVDGVHTLVAGGVSAYSVRGYVEHHQAFFGYGGLHARRFANDGYVDGRQEWKRHFDALFARNLFLARC